MSSIWTSDEIASLSGQFGIRAGCELYPGAEDYHFPQRDFLACGYAPPGGYVKDFSIVHHEGRFHLFHIDGRPGEKCWITGNEISFGHASTTDFRRWIRHPMPLAIGERVWESEHVWAPFVHQHDGLFYMFYMGKGQDQTFISYATSTDLNQWTRWREGPITSAIGRDPFVFTEQEQTVLVYTGHGGARVCACASRDMITWDPRPDLLNIPGGAAAESPSLHAIHDGFVLWFNDYGSHLSGFRAAYAISRDPACFDPKTIHEFTFQTEVPGTVASPETTSNKPFPLSIELVARGPRTWLVAYFRWHGDRNRLFFGELDWSVTPARIREISQPDHLQSVLREVQF